MAIPTPLQPVTLSCPVCAAPFASRVVTGTTAFGGKRTDFQERVAGPDPLPHLIHSCPDCGYTGVTADYDPEHEELEHGVRAQVWDVLAPRARDGRLRVGSEKYEAAALCAEWAGQAARFLADYWLRAAWCAVHEGDTEAERFYRRRAVAFFSAALDSYDGVADEERAVLTYLVGELYRRIGDRAQAAQWLGRVPDAVRDPVAQQWVVDLAAQQAHAPREWF